MHDRFYSTHRTVGISLGQDFGEDGLGKGILNNTNTNKCLVFVRYTTNLSRKNVSSGRDKIKDKIKTFLLAT